MECSEEFLAKAFNSVRYEFPHFPNLISRNRRYLAVDDGTKYSRIVERDISPRNHVRPRQPIFQIAPIPPERISKALWEIAAHGRIEETRLR
jgi:hypothetical protein